ncbi:Gtr1/RagA G protein conserved region-domain-containing protein [Paraphysoderma sedebokerense]|nr:Gtr1/RagA G protein conserved region-domain-containing protein [Paraphysoderma sedebokerense]
MSTTLPTNQPHPHSTSPIALPLPRVLLMGLRRSGKTSIQKVVFHKMSPNETLFLESTTKMGIEMVNSFMQFQIADFPGQIEFTDEGVFDAEWIFGGTGFVVEDDAEGREYILGPDGDNAIGNGLMGNDEEVNIHGEGFGNGMQEQHLQQQQQQNAVGSVGAIVFVIDSQDDYYEALQRLYITISTASKYNPNINFEVFIHKVDGLSDESKIETQRDIHQRVTDELLDLGLLDRVSISFYLTSIYDHSIYEAFSKVVQKLIPQLPTLENLLNVLCSNSNIEKAFLFDTFTKIYIATDSSPVDMQSYEICSDMIDVMIDLDAIYGSPLQKSQGNSQSQLNSYTIQSPSPSPYPHTDPSSPENITSANSHADLVSSTEINVTSGQIIQAIGGARKESFVEEERENGSLIKLSNGMVLYLRHMDKYLALLCLLRSENFEEKQGLLEYNFWTFKDAIWQVFEVHKKFEAGRSGVGVGLK